MLRLLPVWFYLSRHTAAFTWTHLERGNMRSYAAWLQWGHLKPGCCKARAFTPAEVVFLLQGSSVLFCLFQHSSESRTTNPGASKIVLPKAQTENTHVQAPPHLSFSLSHKNLFPVSCLSRTHTLTTAYSEREEDRWDISWEEAADVICYNSALISIFSNLPGDL